MFGDTWSPTAPTSTLKYILADYSKHKTRVQKLYLIEAFIQANLKDIFFVKLDSRYEEQFPYHCNYFGRLFIPKKSMYVMANPGNTSADKLTNLLIDEAGFE